MQYIKNVRYKKSEKNRLNTSVGRKEGVLYFAVFWHIGIIDVTKDRPSMTNNEENIIL